MSARVLVVDDEPQILRALRVVLRSEGYEVDEAATKAEGLAMAGHRPPDVMVLDLVLPDGSGVELCEQVRQWSRLPILVLSAVGDEHEKVRALDAGADDYVTKPFGNEELLARIRAAMRRVGAESVVRTGELAVDLGARRVTVLGEEVHLTPIEFDLLRVLAARQGSLVTQAELMREVWGPQYEDETHYLRVHLSHVRAKIEPDSTDPSYVLTEPGVGYRLSEISAAED